MEKILEWLSSKFQHPLSALFFFLGALLILLGVSTGLNIPVLSQIASDASFRWVSLIAGFVSCLLSVLIYYRPPQWAEKTDKISTAVSIPEELTLDFIGRRATLSQYQDDILTYISQNVSVNSSISQDILENKFSQYNQGELLYRLEHLRLLGFLERQRLGKDDHGNDRFSYRLSPEYQKALGDPVSIDSLRIAQHIRLGGEITAIKGVPKSRKKS